MGICICCCCNKKETDCIENTLIVFCSIEIVFHLLGLILIEWKIASSLCLVLNIIIFIFLVFSLATVILFKIFRDNDTIYSKFRKLCYILAYLCMGFSLACVFLSIISESLIPEKIFQYDHPCSFMLKNAKNPNNYYSANKIWPAYKNYNTTEEIQQECKKLDPDYFPPFFWYYNRSSPKDIIMSYICSSIIEVFSLIGAFLWYNDVRRIKYCIKKKMNDERGLIKYGPLGGYKGTNVRVNKIYDNKNEQNGNEEILGIRDNRNVNMNTNRNRDNIVSSRNSFNELNITNNNNRNDNLQNEDVVNQGENEDIIINNIEQKEETKRKDSISEEDFY